MAGSSAVRTRNMRARRAREAAGAPPAVRDADELLGPAIEETLAALGLAEVDQAAAMARQYARIIDGHPDHAYAFRWLAPLLLACLSELQATPMSRKAAKPTQREPTQLDRLRAARGRSGAV